MLTPFKNAVSLAELDWNTESADLSVKCGAQLSQEVSDYRAVLSKVISAKERIPPVVASPVMPAETLATAGLSSACPVKLAKIDNIEFSGDFTDPLQVLREQNLPTRLLFDHFNRNTYHKHGTYA